MVLPIPCTHSGIQIWLQSRDPQPSWAKKKQTLGLRKERKEQQCERSQEGKMNWQQLHSSRIVSMGKPKENHVYIKDILAPWYYRSKFDIDYLIARETFSSRTQNKKGQKNIMSLLHYRETHGHIPCNMLLKFVYYTRLKSRKRAKRYEKQFVFGYL